MSSEQPHIPGGISFDLAGVVRTVTSPLGLLALVVVVVLGVAIALKPSGYLGYGLVAILLVVLAIVLYAISSPDVIDRLVKPVKHPPTDWQKDAMDSHLVQTRVEEQGDTVAFFVADERRSMDYWYRSLRPVVHQAAMYSTPTYYLDPKLGIVDWNIAFELIFNDMTDKIRGKHVNWFIARLLNHSQVFDHAKKFTEDYERTGVFPFVDIEPLEYSSRAYGKIQFTKVATQLHSVDGQLKGWAIALLVDSIGDRATFVEDLQKRVNAEKMWSVYSASYDRVLNRFPPYKALIRDVTSVVRGKNQYVADLGAGTGNVTAELLAAGHRVLAVETNAGMLDRFAQRNFPTSQVSVVKTSVEQLSCLSERMFDYAVMVNVLYAVDDPLACLRSVHRILKPGGALGMSTTHRDTDLSPLLNAIEAELQSRPDFDELADDWQNLRKINRMLEKSVVRRHTRDEYLEWLNLAGFEVTNMVPSTYCDAVMIVHARRAKDPQAAIGEKTNASVEVLT